MRCVIKIFILLTYLPCVAIIVCGHWYWTPHASANTWAVKQNQSVDHVF